MSEDRLAIFTNYPGVPKDQALEETVLTLFYLVVHNCFQQTGGFPASYTVVEDSLIDVMRQRDKGI